MLSLGVTFAEVNVTGTLDQGLANIKGTLAGVETDKYSGLMSAYSSSFITFSGNEDLGSGLKVNFKFENKLDLNGGSLLGSNAVPTYNNSGLVNGFDTAWNSKLTGGQNREAWVGISGDVGEVKLGTQYTPAFSTAAGTDPQGVDNLLGWSPLLVLAGNSAISNSQALTYVSPNLNGFSIELQGTYGGADTAGAGSSAGDGAGLSLNYASGPFTAGYAQHQDTYSEAGTLSGPFGSLGASGNQAAIGDSVKTEVIALTYDLGMAKLTYLNTASTVNNDKVRVDTIGVNIPLGAFTLGYSNSAGTTKAAGHADVSSQGQQLGVYYSFSKRTNAYFLYSTLKDTTNDADVTSSALGIKHSF